MNKPNIIKRALDKLAGAAGYKPAALAKRQFTAAAINRLTADWSTYSQTIDTIIRNDLTTLRARSRELSRNNPYVQKFLFMLKTNVLGSAGLALKMKVKERDVVVNNTVTPGRPDVFANKVIEENWWQWGRRGTCTVDGRLCWEEVKSLCITTAAVDGEFLVRMIIGPAANNAWGFTLQILDTERLDIRKSERLSNGNVVNMGVEVNQFNKPVAFWMLKRSPNDYATPYPIETVATEHDRIPAEEIVHPYLLRYVGQTRGFPWMSSVMLNTQMLGGYEEAELVASRGAANKFAVLETTGDLQYQGEDGKFQMAAEPGSIEQLPQGMTLKPIDWNHPNSNYGNFVKSALRGIAAGLNVNYATLANDLEAVNFSSGRMGQMEEREHWQFLQTWLAESFCQPIFEKWLMASLMSGKVGLPLSKFDKFNSPTWQGRRWSWVDPTKEVSAKIQELNAGLTSLTRVLGEMGVDRDELLDEIAEDKAALESRGIDLPELWQEAPDEMELAKVKAGAGQEPADRSVHVAIHQPEIKQPVTVNVVADNRSVKKKVEFSRDEKGRPTGATVIAESRYNENHDPDSGQFTSGDGGGGGSDSGEGGDGGGSSGNKKERLRDRIEGTQKEADNEVKKTAKAVEKAQAAVDAVKEKIQALKDSKDDKTLAAMKEKYESLGKEIEESKAKSAEIATKIQASNDRIAALKAKLAASKKRDAESDLETEVAKLKLLIEQLKAVNDSLEKIESAT